MEARRNLSYQKWHSKSLNLLDKLYAPDLTTSRKIGGYSFSSFIWKQVHIMKRNLPYVFSLAILSICSNLALVIDFIIRDYSKEKDFMSMVLALLFLSSLLILLSRSIYTQQLTHGEKSVQKLTRIILFLCWIDLMFVSFSSIEGIHAEQNPISNHYVVYSWILISILVAIIYWCEKKVGNLNKGWNRTISPKKGWIIHEICRGCFSQKVFSVSPIFTNRFIEYISLFFVP